MAKTKYDLDINKQAIIKPVVILRQGDHDIDTMQVSLSVANEPMDLTGATVTFMGDTANGRQIIDDAHVKIIDAKGGVFEYVFPSEASSDIGEYKVAYFSIILGNGQSSTMDFRVQVLSGVDISAPVASEYITHYDTMVTALNSAYDSATYETNKKMASTVSSLANSAATVLDSALARVNDIDSTANNASSAASNAVSMASSVASAVTSQASYINSVASSAASNVSSVAASVVDKLNNISLGGRNLLVGSRNFDGEGWYVVGNITSSDFQGLSSVSGTHEWSGPKYYNATLEKQGKIISTSTQYVLSAWVNNTGTTPVDVNFYSNDVEPKSYLVKTLPANSGWVRIASKPFNYTKKTGLTETIRFENVQEVQGGVLKQVGYKLETGNVPTDWTPAPEDINPNLSVGGRNYILNSSGMNASETTLPAIQSRGKGASSSYGTTLSYNSDSITLTLTENGIQEWYYSIANAYQSYASRNLDKTKQYTISVDVKGTVPYAAFRVNDSLSPSFAVNSSTWTRLTYTFKFPALSSPNEDNYFIRLNAAGGNFVIGQTLSFRNFKLELGNVATDWTPAPEDADNTYVKKSGDTMTGGLKGGQVNLPASGDLNTLTDTGKYYQTTSVNAQNWVNRPSNAPSLAFSVDVIGQANQSLATQVYYVHTTSRMWVRTMWADGTTIKASPWVELANDDNVVHKTSNETVAGDKTFTGNVTIPKNKVTVNTAYGTFTLTKTLDIVHIQSHVSKDIPDNINVPNVVPQGFRPDGVSVPMTFIHGLDKGVIAINPDGSLYTSSNIVPNTSFLAASWAVAGN